MRLAHWVGAIAAVFALLSSAHHARAQATSVFVDNIPDSFGVDFLADGRLLVARQFGGSIVVEATNGVTVSQYGFFPGGGVRGLAISGPGDAYVVDNANQRVVRLPSTCPGNCPNNEYVFAPAAYEVLFDSLDNGYVSLFSSSEISFIEPCVGACPSSPFATGVSDPNLIEPAGMAIGPGGDLFVASSNRILRYVGGCVQPCTSTTFATVNAGARGLVFDTESDSFYVSSGGAGGNTIQRITSAGVVSSFASISGGGLENMTLGPDDRLYVSAPGLSQVIAVELPQFAPPPPAPVPTLSEWAMILMGLLLAGFAVSRIRRTA